MFNTDALLDPDNVFGYYPCFNGIYAPTPEALVLIRQRIAEKIAMKPEWYRWTNTAAPDGHFMRLRLQGIS
jgi:deoxyribonuclease (pyrimidine dimer)